MIGNLIQQQFFEAENWPFGAALTIVTDGLPADLHGLLPALAARPAQGRGGRMNTPAAAAAPMPPAEPPPRPRSAGSPPGVRPPAVPEARSPWLVFVVALRADRDRDPVLVQLDQVARSIRGVLPAVVRGVLRTTPTLKSSLRRVAGDRRSSRWSVRTILGTTLAFGLVRVARPLEPGRQRPHAGPAGHARDRHRRASALLLFTQSRHAALADHDHDRPDHLLDLLRHRDRARPARRR